MSDPYHVSWPKLPRRYKMPAEVMNQGGVDITLTVDVPNTFRVARVQSMFDLPVKDHIETHIRAEVDLDGVGDWRIGAIVGNSGVGKSTVARRLFGEENVWLPERIEWTDQPIVEDFAKGLSVDQVTEAMISVGLSSPPAWLRPYRCLSTGEQFRAAMARLLSDARDLVVVDEFTSVVDRTVARAVSNSVSKAMNQQPGKRFVAVSCHRDIIPWLQPDWVLDMDTGQFFRPGAERRPDIQLRVYPGTADAWSMFYRYHYLTWNMRGTSRVFLATIIFADEGIERLCGFFSIMPAMGMRGWYRGHRTVVLPDFQGMGIGNNLVEKVGDWLWEKEGKRLRTTTSAPSFVKHRLKHPEAWKMTMGPMMKRPSGNKNRKILTSAGRLSTSWEYIPAGLRGGSLEGVAVEGVGVGVESAQAAAAFVG